MSVRRLPVRCTPSQGRCEPTQRPYPAEAFDHSRGHASVPGHFERPADMPAPDAGGCQATRGILDRISDKWSLYIIATLANGTRRFNELKRGIDGISQRMLTLTLRGLKCDGLVARTMYATIPPRVDYELTELLDQIVRVIAAHAP